MKSKNSKPAVLICLRLVAAIALVVFSGCGAIERQIIYCPKPFAFTASDLSEEKLAGVSVEDVHFAAADGTRLHGWLATPASEAEAESSQIVLFSHGRGCNMRTFQQDLLDFVRRHKVTVMAYDYRGFGSSEGKPSENGLYQDARAARAWLADRFGIEESNIVLMGRSLGSAVAIELAATDGADTLVIECAFTSTQELLQHYTRGLLSGQSLQSRFNSIDKIGQFQGRLFVGHATDDKTIPPDQSVRLANAATQAQQTVLAEFSGGHASSPDEPYHESLGQFLQTR